MSSSPGLLPWGGSWLEPAPGISVPAERLCGCFWVWAAALGRRDGEGKLSSTLFTTTCFFTDEVGEWVGEESPSSSP